MSPETTSGQMFCIGYAILAIGTTLVMLANVGSGLAKGLIYTYRFQMRDKSIMFN